MGRDIKIKFGQVWKTNRDYLIDEPQAVEYRGCIIPKDTRILVLNTPLSGSAGFHIMPIISKGLNKKLVPDLKLMEERKEGFGIIVLIEKFKKYFVFDENQDVKFDNSDSDKFWKTVIAHHDFHLEEFLSGLNEKSLKEFMKQTEKHIMKEDEISGRAKIIRIK